MPYATEPTQGLLRDINENAKSVQNSADRVLVATQDKAVQDEMDGIQEYARNILEAARFLEERIQELEYELTQRQR